MNDDLENKDEIVLDTLALLYSSILTIYSIENTPDDSEKILEYHKKFKGIMLETLNSLTKLRGLIEKNEIGQFIQNDQESVQ